MTNFKEEKKHAVYWEDIRDFFGVCFLILAIFWSIVGFIYFIGWFVPNDPPKRVEYQCYQYQGEYRIIESGEWKYHEYTSEEQKKDLQEYAGCLKEAIDEFNRNQN